MENYGSTDIGKIYSNTINMAPGNIPTPLHVGIELNSVTNVNVANNLIDGLGRGFWFSGDNRQNEIECNMVRDYEVGWAITYSTGLGTQGMGSLPQDNQWVIRNNQTTFNKLWDIEAIAAGQTEIWYRPANGLPYKPIDIYDPSFVTIRQSGPSYTNNDCSPNPGSNKDDLITGDRRLPTTTLEELALKRESMENTYRILMASSNLTPDQILYRDSLDAISVGYYGKLIDSLYAKNVSYTEQMLAQTNCTCPIDESMKRVMEVYTKTFAVGIDTFTAGQLDTLMEIAYTPKHLSHRAVVSARIMLKTGYDITLDFESDLAVSPKIVKTEDLQTIEPIYTQVYPNPAYETIWIECPIGSEILITDLLGKTYIKTQNQEEMVSIDLQALPSGMYFIKIVHDDFVNTHKVVINKKCLTVVVY
ncbi:MAG: hypothetical protein KatS3mg035_2008 [Bacteroidia bacterium]|nr:MAG: hypothetical protein KatS3mg035_2008 [Bacteroidia bacterium]